MKRAFIFAEYQLKHHCCSISATSGSYTLIKSMSVEENVPLGTNCKLNMTSYFQKMQDGGIKFLSPLLPHRENPPPAFNTITVT